jgi:hypothetical protein
LSFKDSDVDAKFPRMIMFADSNNWEVYGTEARNSPASWEDSVSWSGFGKIAFRHGGKANAVLANGSVIRIALGDVTVRANYNQYFPPMATRPLS